MNAALNRLGSLPGMMEVKQQVDQIISFVKVSNLRERHGLKSQRISNHMLFLGNPGTGKSTAARLIGEAFADLGILKTGSSKDIPFIEIHHADVTHPHVGQAERTIKKKFNEARGGVIFIDEAYAFIAGESSHMTGDKVVTAIVQLMEDMREEIMVIAAGYPKETLEFIDSNPGLRSRFTNTVHFPDYSVPDMVAIAQSMLAERDYQGSADYYEALVARLWLEKEKPGFGNARTVRNLVEQSIKSHSVRIVQNNNPSRQDIVLLTGADMQFHGKALSEKECLLKAKQDIEARLFELELREILSKRI